MVCLLGSFLNTLTHLKPLDLIYDPNFHVKLENNSPVIKQKHPNGYFSQIQLSIGLSSDIQLCDLMVYNFKGLILIIIKKGLYFLKVLNKLYKYYKDYFK